MKKEKLSVEEYEMRTKRNIRESRGDYMGIQSHQELTTYAGTTIVENDADCYMEVSADGGDTLRAKKLALILGE